MGTSTQTFGTGKREGHDSSAFYARGLASPNWSTDTTVAQVPRKYLDRILEHSSEDMHENPGQLGLVDGHQPALLYLPDLVSRPSGVADAEPLAPSRSGV